jgi:uncharacterized OB-fold protein
LEIPILEENMAEYRKPLPMADADSKEFWDGCQRHELLLQKCDACHKYYFPPGPVCPHCFSTKVTWTKASGKGSVYTYTNVRRALGPDWEAEVPYTVGVIELVEGPRMVSDVIGCKPEEVKIGMPLEVVFEDVTEANTLPKFKPT